MIVQCLATLSYPQVSPPGFTLRDSKRNTFLGATLSQSRENELVLGLSYQDLKDGKTDEDHFLVNLTEASANHFPKGRYEKINNSYIGTHRGDKGYLSDRTRNRP